MGQRIFVESYGCTLSKSETGLYVNKLLQDGSTIVDSPEKADISVIGTCVVIKHTEDRMLKRIGELSEKSRVRVMGCLPPITAGSLEDGRIEVVKAQEFRGFYQGGLDDIEIREPSIFEGIPINQGCTGSCNFCISHISRGSLLSRPVNKIRNQVSMQLERGIREVKITSLDTAAYGKDTGARLPELVDSITSLDGDFRLRVGMMEPRNTSEIIQDLMESYENRKVFKFMHLPVQSGSDEILDSMNREYHVEDFLKIVDVFREHFSKSVLSTDIISGYQGDDEQSFSDTMKLIERTQPEIVNITRFSQRPFTKDQGARTPSSEKVKRWTAAYSSLHKEILQRKLEKQLNREVEILITEKGKDLTYVGRDDSYTPVVVPGEHTIHERMKCEIVDIGQTYLVGKAT